MLPLYKKIEHLCQSKNINITEMCRRANVPRSALSDYKTGRKKTISLANLEKIADLFCISLDELTGRETAENEKAPTPEGELSEDAVSVAKAYDVATDKQKQMVHLALDL